jgi:hypothetical protein
MDAALSGLTRLTIGAGEVPIAGLPALPGAEAAPAAPAWGALGGAAPYGAASSARGGMFGVAQRGEFRHGL